VKGNNPSLKGLSPFSPIELEQIFPEMWGSRGNVAMCPEKRPAESDGIII
jgi:hypothetical protein